MKQRLSSNRRCAQMRMGPIWETLTLSRAPASATIYAVKATASDGTLTAGREPPSLEIQAHV